MFNEIQLAIYQLEGKNVDRKNMIIVFPNPLVRMLEREGMELYAFNHNPHSIGTLFGVEVWPHGHENSIVIYDKERILYYPELIVRIPIKTKDNTRRTEFYI